MHPLLLYTIKVITCSGILVGYYWFGLRNKVFHHYNRFYLLAVVVLSLILPMIKINFWQQQQNTTTVFKLLQAVNTDHETLDEIVLTSNTNAVDWEQVSLYLYAAVVSVLLLIFIKTLATIYVIYRKHEKASAENITLIQTEAKGTPFSFFQLIFWNIHIDLQSPTGKRILQHEIAHVQQKHSYDKIFINLVLIACWCNPFFWLIRKELNMIHEFTADRQAVKDHDTTAFAAMILQATYPQHRFDITNQFFYSPIKRRLMMLTKNNHTKAGYISRIMVLPLAALVFVAFTFKAKTIHTVPFTAKKIKVVIDAGHGGTDFGGTDGKGIYEKDISLAIAQKVKALNSNSNIEILLTRETDVYQTPPEKADFVNANKADLMVSIHVDAVEKNPGIKVYVAKNQFTNVPTSKVLASAILGSFSKDFPLTTSSQPVQRNKGIWILQASRCPSVLLEAGNLRETRDLAFLKTDAGKEAIANKVLQGIEQYLLANEANAFNKSTIDTVPFDKTKRYAIQEIDPKKALIIENGKVIGIGDDAEKNRTFQGDSMHVNWLEPAQAVAKYGTRAKYGACELTYSNKMGYKILDNDKQLVIANGKVIGNGKDAKAALEKLDKTQEFYNFQATINSLQPKEAIAKYGKAAEYGAIEVTYSYEPKIKLADPITVLKKASADPEPLYIVDGKEISASEKDKIINPEKINVLKGSAAVAAYGAKGTNGVVEIYTKKQTDTGVQTKAGNTNSQNQEMVFVKVEKEAEFPGGNAAWARYMKKINEEFTPAKETPPGTYLVWIRFIVSKDGSISEVVGESKHGYGLEEQAIDMIKKGPKWKPARQNGHDVSSYYHQPVTYVVN